MLSLGLNVVLLTDFGTSQKKVKLPEFRIKKRTSRFLEWTRDFLTNSGISVNRVFLISWPENKTGGCGIISLVYSAAGGSREVAVF